ncbi:hypothetical protein [Stutzerimonas nitrititolerans]|uniref:hypothetical protein n=1 Tax=Stutzerimonas nitrititolerans TaxID=2482751 RepID=UPI0028A87F01|nr:hypothetical protein [Stutzerimonas nitrititolerans]
MANRSKKVVLSARVDPYLKAGIDLLAAAQRVKMVALMERFLEFGLEESQVENPFASKKNTPKISFLLVLQAIWTDDEVLFQLRAGALGAKISGDDIFDASFVVLSLEVDYFAGEDDIFGDLNGLTSRMGLAPVVPFKVNLPLVKEEWDSILAYVQFLKQNKPFQPTFDEYKTIMAKSLK